MTYEPKGFALKIFNDRYSIHAEESFIDACRRVADYIACAENGKKRSEYAERFFRILSTNKFSPGGRIWRGAGRPRGQLLNCFCWSDDLDSREGWGDALRAVTIISGMGGGVGISFSKVRPRGSAIRGTGGEATGAVSLMRAINAVCDQLREGGGRRSALMFCLNYDHPDLAEFLEAKFDNAELNNANISVCINDMFLKLVDEDKDIIFKWKGEERGSISAKYVWDKIVENAWNSGDPGLLNLGLMNKMNTINYIGDIISTNPCGEVTLMAYECCCLGAINLSQHIVDEKVDFDTLEETVAIAVRFLDNVLDQNHYPMREIEEMSQKNRRIGLGIMGLHDMLLKLGHKYDSAKGRKVVDRVMGFIKKIAYETSIMLAIEKGPFHSFNPEQHIQSGFAKTLTKSLRRKILQHGIRNCALLTIAPTGTISIVADCSAGIEPLFHLVYRLKFNEHANQHDKEREASQAIIAHPLVKQFLKDKKSLEHFQAAHEITPENHLAMQATCQKHIDNSISKTINLPNDYPVAELSDVMRQFIDELKGITVYRDGSKGESPMQPVSLEEAKKHLKALDGVSAVDDCPKGYCEI